jgi:hypothetical protein
VIRTASPLAGGTLAWRRFIVQCPGADHHHAGGTSTIGPRACSDTREETVRRDRGQPFDGVIRVEAEGAQDKGIEERRAFVDRDAQPVFAALGLCGTRAAGHRRSPSASMNSPTRDLRPVAGTAKEVARLQRRPALVGGGRNVHRNVQFSSGVDSAAFACMQA